MSHLSVLLRAPKEDLSNEFIVSGIIDKFFIQFELGWKLLKEMLAYDGPSMEKWEKDLKTRKEVRK